MKNQRILKIFLASNGDVPNNPRLPILIYRAIIEKHLRKKGDIFEAHFHESGWRGVWRDTIYNYCHFHSNAHEALGIARGQVKIELGGENGRVIKLKAGDMIVLPVGTGHKRKAATKNLIVVGCYPKGQEKYNMCRQGHTHQNVTMKIARTALPKSDPFFGESGPLTKYWKF